MAVLEYEDRNYLNLQFQELRKAVCNSTAAEQTETRPICIEQGDDPDACVRAYAVVSVTATETTVLRVETAEGTVIDSAVPTDCTCDCTDTYVPPDPE